MKVNTLRDLSTAELEKKVDNLKEELFNLRFQMAHRSIGKSNENQRNP